MPGRGGAPRAGRAHPPRNSRVKTAAGVGQQCANAGTVLGACMGLVLARALGATRIRVFGALTPGRPGRRGACTHAGRPPVRAQGGRGVTKYTVLGGGGGGGGGGELSMALGVSLGAVGSMALVHGDPDLQRWTQAEMYRIRADILRHELAEAEAMRRAIVRRAME
jgi:hypothetical protein